MTILQAFILGLVQGLTEFIPVSSSGHLVLFHEIFDGPGDLGFDVALHFGTLLALLVYFRKDLLRLLRRCAKPTSERKTVGLLLLATIPAAVAGYFLEDTAETTFRSPILVASMLILVALLMLLAEHINSKRETKTVFEKIRLPQALAIGIAQACALVPGVSRSGGTITAGLLVGVDRVAATRFAFLLAIPIIFGATLKTGLEPQALDSLQGQTGVYITGIAAAFASGLFAIRFLLKYLARHTLKVFAYYRIGLGLIVLLVLL
jgi:undecaprenyl-diphosphatase